MSRHGTYIIINEVMAAFHLVAFQRHAQSARSDLISLVSDLSLWS
jgi:hypothetical protein